MAKVLVTGGAGFIGSHLCDRLLERGDDVIVLDDLSMGREDNLRHSGGRLTFIRDSVLNVARHSAALADVELVFHLAAQISGYDSLKTPDSYLETNVTGLLRLLEACASMRRPHVVFASSSTVYGNRAEPVCRESDLPAPVTLYALSKLAGEHLLPIYAATHGYTFSILRLFNVYGPRQNPRHPYANVTCKFSHAAARGLPVKLYGDGLQSRDFVYVDDVVAAMLRAAEARLPAPFNVGTGRSETILELLDVVQRLAAHSLEVERCPPWKNDIRAIRADGTRASRELGFQAVVPLEVGLRRTIDFFREHER